MDTSSRLTLDAYNHTVHSQRGDDRQIADSLKKELQDNDAIGILYGSNGIKYYVKPLNSHFDRSILNEITDAKEFIETVERISLDAFKILGIYADSQQEADHEVRDPGDTSTPDFEDKEIGYTLPSLLERGKGISIEAEISPIITQFNDDALRPATPIRSIPSLPPSPKEKEFQQRSRILVEEKRRSEQEYYSELFRREYRWESITSLDDPNIPLAPEEVQQQILRRIRSTNDRGEEEAFRQMGGLDGRLERISRFDTEGEEEAFWQRGRLDGRLE